MVIGSLGDIIFEVSREKINTFDNAEWSGTTRYAAHDRHLNDTLLEFIGNDPDEISFTMELSSYLGIDPMTEMVKIIDYKRKGTLLSLIIGSKTYGKYRWVITRHKFGMKKYDNAGNLLASKATVSLKAYSSR